eukprot:932760-Rhodomonas_salina.1
MATIPCTDFQMHGKATAVARLRAIIPGTLRFEFDQHSFRILSRQSGSPKWPKSGSEFLPEYPGTQIFQIRAGPRLLVEISSKTQRCFANRPRAVSSFGNPAYRRGTVPCNSVRWPWKKHVNPQAKNVVL